MFYHMALEKEILVHPKYFGRNLISTVKKLLVNEVEGSFSTKYGHIVAVTAVDQVGRGVLQQDRGFALYRVKYRAIVLRLFAGEVVEAVVQSVNKLGMIVQIGPITGILSRHSLSHSFEFDPLAEPPCYRDINGIEAIHSDDDIRIKITSVLYVGKEAKITASMDGDYLGLIK